MTKPMKGFEALYSDPDPPETGVMPLPGTDAYLAWVAEKKKKEKERKRQEGESPPFQPHPQEDGTDILKQTTSPSIVVQPATIPTIADIPSIAVEASGQEVEITDNFMRFDLAIFDLMASLTDGELRIYLAFIRWTYGQTPPTNACTASFRQLGEASGVTSPNSHVKILHSLEEKGLIKRLSRASGKGQASSFRVFLPRELPDNTSKTSIRYSKYNRFT